MEHNMLIATRRHGIPLSREDSPVPETADEQPTAVALRSILKSDFRAPRNGLDAATKADRTALVEGESAGPTAKLQEHITSLQEVHSSLNSNDSPGHPSSEKRTFWLTACSKKIY